MSASFSLRLLRDPLDFGPDAQQVAAPDLADLLLRIAAAYQLDRHVHRLRGAVESVHAAAAVEVRRDADVVDADELHRIVDVIDVVLDGRTAGRGPLPIDLRHPPLELRAAIRRQRLGALRAAAASTARHGRGALDGAAIRRGRGATPRAAASGAAAA